MAVLNQLKSLGMKEYIKRTFREMRKFGFQEFMVHLLAEVGVLDYKRVYESRCKHYYYKLNENEYEKELKEWYSIRGGGDNLDAPKTFNGKIQWLKINDYMPIKTTLSDKYLVREWIKEKIGEKYLVELLGVYDTFDDINFEELPKQFVIKANHGSGMILVVKDKAALDLKHARKEVTRWMNTIFGYDGMEIQYFQIPRKILIEKYVEQMDGGLFDYKIYCFGGKPTFIQLIGDRDFVKHRAHEAFFDVNWNVMPFHHKYPLFERKIDKPENLAELITVAEKLSQGFKYVRVDLYIISGEIKFGEMTFTPSNGLGAWNPVEADYELGKMIELD